jgi:RNA polymerase sigma-70 factor (ECF subfamily)
VKRARDDVLRVIAPALGGLVALAHAVAAAGVGRGLRRPVAAVAASGGRPAFLAAAADGAAVGPFAWSAAGSGVPATEDPQQLRLIALVDLARGGDTEAFGQLYDHYVGAVYRYVYYRVGSHSLAEDLTSETFLRALRAIGEFRWQGRDIGAWFTTIARNLIADHVKSSRFRLEVSTADLLDADRADGGPEDAVLRRLDAARLLDAVRKLTSEQQECVTLRFLQGLSVAETAEVMGRREGAVKQLQLRAVRALARLLADGTQAS